MISPIQTYDFQVSLVTWARYFIYPARLANGKTGRLTTATERWRSTVPRVGDETNDAE